MPLIGPIKLKHYLGSTTPSPNPVLNQSVAFEAICCANTGRIWINDGTAQRPVLPYVRTDAGLTGVQMVNNSGNLKCVLTTGATSGNFNAFDKLTVDSTAAYLPNYTAGSSGPVYCDRVTGKLSTSFPARAILTSDFTGTFASTVSTLTALTVTATASAMYNVQAVLTFYHNNQYDMTAGFQFYKNASNYGTIASSTTHSQSGGWTSIFLTASTLLDSGDCIKVQVVPSVDDVVVKALPAFTFPTAGSPSMSNSASYVLYQRIA